MPIEIRVSDNGLGSIVTGQGQITSREYMDFYREYLLNRDVSLYGYKYNLTDWSGVSDVDITPVYISEVGRISQKAAEKEPGCAVAIVAGNDLLYGLSRMWENHSRSTSAEVMVFRERIEAICWLREKVRALHGIDDLKFD